MNADIDRGHAIVHPDDVAHSSANSKVPGEFRRPTDALSGGPLAVTLAWIPAHSASEQGTGHHHEEIEDDSLVTGGTLTMRLSDAIETVRARAGRAPARPARSATTAARTEKSHFLLKAATHRNRPGATHHARLLIGQPGSRDQDAPTRMLH
jgi:hypothetical protein